MVGRTRKSMLDKEAKIIRNYFSQIRFYKRTHTQGCISFFVTELFVMLAKENNPQWF